MRNPLKTLFQPGADLTGRATADVVGARFVAQSAAPATPWITTDVNLPVAHAAAGVRALGVSKYDAKTGRTVGIKCAPGTIVCIIADGNIPFNSGIEVGTDGKAKALNAGARVGTARDTVVSGALCPITLFN